VEGNNINADLWLIENLPGTMFAERSGDAANSFELWPTDLDLARNMGLNSYRFSLEWARIEPDKGHFSNAMLDHYKAMIDGCRARSLNPVVTFNHFTTPRWFAAQGGWHHAESPISSPGSATARRAIWPAGSNWPPRSTNPTWWG
jgi:beta-glucosidase